MYTIKNDIMNPEFVLLRGATSSKDAIIFFIPLGILILLYLISKVRKIIKQRIDPYRRADDLADDKSEENSVLDELAL